MGAICGGPGGVARTSRMQLGGVVFFLWLCWLYGGCKDEMPAATKKLFEIIFDVIHLIKEEMRVELCPLFNGRNLNVTLNIKLR
jgi:hypothetical protein